MTDICVTLTFQFERILRLRSIQKFKKSSIDCIKIQYKLKYEYYNNVSFKNRTRKLQYSLQVKTYKFNHIR
jgi:hypothetical protein